MARRGKPKDNYFENVQKIGEYIDLRTIFYPVKENTLKLREAFGTKHWVATTLQLDKYRYFVYRITIHDKDNQLWVSGDTMWINQNPNKKVLIRSFCSKTKKWCCGFEGSDSHEFFSICPYCGKIFVAVNNTPVPCDYCKREIVCDSSLKWIKFNCVNCPVNITLDEANLNINYAKANLYDRIDAKGDQEYGDYSK